MDQGYGAVESDGRGPDGLTTPQAARLAQEVGLEVEEQKASALADLKAAVAAPSTEGLKAAIQRAEGAKLREEDIATARQVLEVEDQKASAMAGLKTAVAAGSIEGLRKAIRKAEEAQLSQDDTAAAQQVLEVEERQASAIAGLKTAVAEHSVEGLSEAIQKAEDAQLSEDDIAPARRALEVEKRQASAFAGLKAAVAVPSIEGLKEAIRKAEDAQCSEEDMASARQALEVASEAMQKETQDAAAKKAAQETEAKRKAGNDHAAAADAEAAPSPEVLPHDRNLPGNTSPEESSAGVMEPVRVDPGDGRYYTLAAMVKISEGKYTKEEAEKYWNEDCRIPARDEPPPPGDYDWFSKLFGFSEASYVDAKRWLKVVPGKQGAGQQLVSKANDMSFAVGSFTTPRLDAMRGKVAGVSLPGKLTVTNELGDVAEKHSYGENRHATFQVASQFNCLEFVHPNVTPEDGVTGYAEDRTQGPACSLACGPATAFRNYFARMAVERGGRPEQYGQTLECMIDNLSDVSEVVGNIGETMYRVHGGYTQSDESKLEVLNARLAQLEKDGRLDEVRAALRIGVHDDVEVTSTAWGQNLLGKPDQTVTQVFGSACAVAYNAQTQPQSWERFASLVLEASYESTLCAALLAAQRHPGEPGARRVFLTSLGGGVFGNPMEWVVVAMRRACERYKEYALDIRVVTYAGEVHPLLQQLENDF